MIPANAGEEYNIKYNDAYRSGYTGPLQGIVKHISPNDHVGSEQEWFYIIEEGYIEGTDDGKYNNGAHADNDGCNGIVAECGDAEGVTGNEQEAKESDAKSSHVTPQNIGTADDGKGIGFEDYHIAIAE